MSKTIALTTLFPAIGRLPHSDYNVTRAAPSARGRERVA
jgi:hypothetical protein